MSPTFSTPSKIVTITATVDTSAVASRWDGLSTVTDGDVRAAAESAMRSAARDNGVSIQALSVTVTDGARTVTLTEEEYNALQSGGASA